MEFISSSFEIRQPLVEIRFHSNTCKATHHGIPRSIFCLPNGFFVDNFIHQFKPLSIYHILSRWTACVYYQFQLVTLIVHNYRAFDSKQLRVTLIHKIDLFQVLRNSTKLFLKYLTLTPLLKLIDHRVARNIISIVIVSYHISHALLFPYRF